MYRFRYDIFLRHTGPYLPCFHPDYIYIVQACPFDLLLFAVRNHINIYNIEQHPYSKTICPQQLTTFMRHLIVRSELIPSFMSQRVKIDIFLPLPYRPIIKQDDTRKESFMTKTFTFAAPFSQLCSIFRAGLSYSINPSSRRHQGRRL